VIYHNYGDVSQELVREQCAQGAKSYTFNLESRTGEPAQLVIYIGGVKFNTIDVAFDEAGAMNGLLIMGVGGLYTVYCQGQRYLVKARGKFRKGQPETRHRRSGDVFSRAGRGRILVRLPRLRRAKIS
jgi:hypothetical protein